MSDWDPERYRRFEAERTRPAHDLLDRVTLENPATIVDLGCGPGNSTELLKRRFPHARVIGVDSSAAMIDEARKRLPTCRFDQADITTWDPEEAPDLIFANAVLQWLPDHAALLPRLLSRLAPKGILAIQMPNNLDAPSHRAMREVADEPPWADRLRAASASRTTLAPLERYYDMMTPASEWVEVWETTYHHPMTSPAAIVDWLRATGLRPFLSRLDDDEVAAFLVRYELRLDAAYPKRADGRRLLGFPRVFIVAQRA